MKSDLERIYNGLIKENPVLVPMLGMCPTLAVTTSASNGFGTAVGFTLVFAGQKFHVEVDEREAAAS